MMILTIFLLNTVIGVRIWEKQTSLVDAVVDGHFLFVSENNIMTNNIK